MSDRETPFPEFVRCFTEQSTETGLSELLDIAHGRAPTECEWLMNHVQEVKAAVTQQLLMPRLFDDVG